MNRDRMRLLLTPPLKWSVNAFKYVTSKAQILLFRPKIVTFLSLVYTSSYEYLKNLICNIIIKIMYIMPGTKEVTQQRLYVRSLKGTIA